MAKMKSLYKYENSAKKLMNFNEFSNAIVFDFKVIA